MEAADLTWRTARASGANGGQCVQIAYGRDGRAAGLVRDSKSSERGHLTVTPDAFSAFLAGVKTGKFDLDQLSVPACCPAPAA
jgi:hypothetical protein